MDEIDILIEYLVTTRRGVLRHDKALGDAIEKLNELKQGNDKDMGVNPGTCAHYFVKETCEKCGIFEHIAEKPAIIKEADKPDK